MTESQVQRRWRSRPNVRGTRYRIAAWLALLMVAAAVSAPSVSATIDRRGVDEPPPVTEVASQAALAVDLTTNIELFDRNADTPLSSASTVKIVTALLASSLLERDARATVEPSEVLDAETYSVMGLLTGDELAVSDLFKGLLIPSGGDAALVLARLGGTALDPSTKDPVGRFVKEMNNWAAANGLSGSHFVNPTGDDAPDQHMTARDLVKATKLLLDDWFLTQIVQTAETQVSVSGPNPRDLQLVNTNQLLSSDDVFGVKTGTDELAGQCIVAGFWRGDNRIIVVVLGSQDRYADVQAVLDEVDGTYRWLALGIGATSAGASDAVAAAGLTFRVRRTVLMSQEQASQVTWQLVREDDGDGGRAGYVSFDLGGREFARLPVYSTTAP